MGTTLGERVARLAQEKGWSHAQLSARAGLGRGTVHDIVRHPERQTRVETVRALAEALGVSEAYLRGEEDADAGAPELTALQVEDVSLAIATPWDTALISVLEADPGRWSAYRVDRGRGRFARGSIVIVDTTEEPAPGDLVVANIPTVGLVLRYSFPPYLVAADWRGGVGLEAAIVQGAWMRPVRFECCAFPRG